MYKLAIPPTSDGYSAKYGNAVIADDVDGGAPRFRLDVIGKVAPTQVTWKLGKREYNYLMAFWRTAAKKGTEPFLVDLILDSADPVEYTAWFMPDTLTLQSQSGLTYFVAATLLIEPLPDDEAADALILGDYSGV